MRSAADELFVDFVGPVQLIVDARDGLLSVFLVLNWIDATAGPAVERVFELCVLAEAAGVAQEWVLLVVVDAPALVALEHVFATVAAHTWIGGNRGRAARALKSFGGSLKVN